MIARALGIDPVEFRRTQHPARGPAAGDRHDRCATRRSIWCSTALAARMGWDRPFERGSGTPAARARHRHRLQGASIAPTTSVAIVQSLWRRQLRRSISAPSTWARARTRRWRRSPAKCSTSRPKAITRRPSRHRRDALRHGDARLALDLPYGPRGAACRRGREGQDRGARRRARHCARQQRARSPSCSAANTACRPATSSASAASCRATRRPITTPASRRQRDAVLDGRRGRGAEVEVDTETGQFRVTAPRQRRRCRHADQSEASSRRSYRARAIMQLGFTVSEKMLFATGSSPTARSPTTRFPSLLDMPREIVNETSSRPQQHDRAVRRKGRGRERDHSACRPPSPTRSRTRSACG